MRTVLRYACAFVAGVTAARFVMLDGRMWHGLVAVAAYFVCVWNATIQIDVEKGGGAE